MGRIGIYELKRENEYRDDWIFIVDFTVELGQQKALVILGVSPKYFQSEVLDCSRCLSHKDVEVLGIEIMDSSKGEMIEQQLDKISKRVGVPVQIVADNGSDLAKGIKLYQQKHPDLIYAMNLTTNLIKDALETHIPHFNFYDTYWSRKLDSVAILPIETDRSPRRKIRLFSCYFSEVRNVG